MGIDGERRDTRQALYSAQAQCYGPKARNILYTLTNVADDLRQQGRLRESDEKYQKALRGADAHKGYDRAKIRFAALEGLGDSWMELAGSRGWSSHGWEVGRHVLDRSALQTATHYLDLAESEGLTWFDGSSYGVLRVQQSSYPRSRHITLNSRLDMHSSWRKRNSHRKIYFGIDRISWQSKIIAKHGINSASILNNSDRT